MKSQSFLGGVLILTIGTLIAKLIGAFYRVPLTWILGTEGLGIYQLVFPIFSLLLVLSSTGMPTAISTMVASRIKNGKTLEAEKIFKISLITLLINGLFIGLLLFIFSDFIAILQGNIQASLSYKAISLAIPLVSILSAFRGYYQGLQNMIPTALSQIIEQFGKLIFGLSIAYLVKDHGITYCAFGAVCGVVLGEITACISVVIYRLKNQKQIVLNEQNLSTNILKSVAQVNYINKFSIKNNVTENKSLIKELSRTAFPIVVASFLLPALQVVDSMLVINLLNIAGYTTAEATNMWGVNAGMVNSIINMPIVLALSVAIAIVPEVSNYKKDITQDEKDKLAKAFNLTANITIPLMVLVLILASYIIPFCYPDNFMDNVNYNDLAVSLLAFSSPIILILSIVQLQNASLQGLGYANIPLKHILIAGVLKVLTLIFCVKIPSINIYGVLISNLVFDFVVYLLNKFFMEYKLKIKQNYKSYLPIMVSTVVMSIFLILGKIAFRNYNIYVALPLELLIGFSTYLFTLYIVGGFKYLDILLKNLKKFVYKYK